MLVFLVMTAACGLYGMAESNDRLQHVTEENAVKMVLLEDMSNSIHVISRVIRSLALISDQATYDREYAKIALARQEYDKASGELQKMSLDKKGQDFMTEINKNRDETSPKNNKFLEMVKTDRENSVDYLLKEANPATAIWLKTISMTSSNCNAS